jgi:hypothetical protein
MKRLWSLVSATFTSTVLLFFSASIANAFGGASAFGGGIHFNLVRSAGVMKAGCLPKARAQVTIESDGPVEEMRVVAFGLPPNTDFDFFVIQVPNTPFGLSWYQGDIETNGLGIGFGRFIGRFNIETFIVAPGSAESPLVFDNAFPDVSPGPATGPIHTYHLGLWFNDPADATKAGCPGTVTPFNGEHNAGIQVLNSSNFPDLAGPLFNLK